MSNSKKDEISTADYLYHIKPANIKPENISKELLDQSLKVIADIVRIYGNPYLPLFIKIHKEIERRKAELSYQEIALQISKNDEY